MFQKKLKNKAVDNVVTQKVNEDLIVHNMPSQKSLSGNGFLEKSGVSASFQVLAPHNNFKKIGALIIIGGFIVIGALIYLSFTFIIKPATKNSSSVAIVKQPLTNIATDTASVSDQSESINVSTATVAVVSPSVDMSLSASSTADNPPLDALNGSTTDQVLPLLDSDNDGLYDEEEIALGTNPNLADSDVDGYPDKTELDGGYNPNGLNKLIDDLALLKYSNKAFNYDILYPKAWDLKEVSVDNTVIFTAPDDSIIQVSVQDNPSKVNIMSWYSDAFSGAALTSDKLITNPTWDGVMSDDGLNYYLTDKKHQKIFIVSYLPIFTNRLAYPSLFKALLNSLVLK